MSRTSVLATAGVALLVACFGGIAASSALDVGGPTVVVVKAPSELILREGGTVAIAASAPAVPGETVYLNTAGAYNSGYVRVSSAVLDRHLRATLVVPGREYLGTFKYWAAVPASATHQEGSSSTFSITIVSPPPQQDPSCGRSAPRKADGTPWVCTFDDEFSGNQLDRRYWVPQQTENSGFTTGTKIQYACALDGPETVGVHHGNLELSLVDLDKTRDCGQNKASRYAYGQVMHYQTYAQTYGKYEVRAKIPDLQEPGSQQSFWLWPVNDTYGPWPASGEIDFAEMYSSAPGIDKPFLHYLPGESPDGTDQNVTHGACSISAGEYNTYGVEWAPGRLTLLLNDKVCFVDEYSAVNAADGSPTPFDQPFYLSLNQAMGTIGNDYSPGSAPQRLTTQVDWVRVWQ